MRRRYRLRTDAQFRRVRAAGRSWAAPLLVLYALRSGEPDSRFGFVVGKRVGKAVVRNLVKRRLRAVCAAVLPQLAAGYDVTVIARAAAGEAGFEALRTQLLDLLQRAGLLEPDYHEGRPT